MSAEPSDEETVSITNGKYHDTDDSDSDDMDESLDSSDVIRELRGMKRVQRNHSEALATISAAVIRIEGRLSTTEAVATRASGTNEALARIVVEEKQDELVARRERRNAWIGVVGKAAAFVFSVAGAGLIASTALKGCGVAGAESAAPPPAIEEPATPAAGAP